MILQSLNEHNTGYANVHSKIELSMEIRFFWNTRDPHSNDVIYKSIENHSF